MANQANETEFDKALALHQAGQWDEAENLYKNLIQKEPDHADTHALYGVLLATKGQIAEGIASLKTALRLDPTAGLFYAQLGEVHGNAGHHRDAMQAYERAAAFLPHAGPLWLKYSDYAERVGDFEKAHAAALTAVRLMPENAAAHFGLGVALNRLARDDEAVTVYQKAIALDPTRADLSDNLGQTYQALGQMAAAKKAFEEAVNVAGQTLPDNPAIDEEKYGERHWHLALIELLMGDYRRGFARYRARFAALPHLRRPILPKPVWRGEEIAGKTLLLFDEQGLGDSLMLARFVPQLKARGINIVLWVQSPLVTYFRQWQTEGIVAAVYARSEKPAAYDYYASLFDVPHLLQVTHDTIPCAAGYLPKPSSSHPFSAYPWASPHKDKKKIGIVWAGQPKHKHDARRSLPLSLWQDILLIPHISFYSLNRDQRPGDAAILAQNHVQDLVPHIHDFNDLAAAMEQLDLIITCDSATAHMAGGLGKDVWTLLPFAPDWRWGQAGDRTVWYQSMRLFRQKAPGDWPGVLKEIQAALLPQK
jgi:tetratricopeptide (TPR) repeat protein